MSQPRRTIYVDADRMEEMLGPHRDSGVTHTVTSQKVIDKTWTDRAMKDLAAFESKTTWAEVYIRCGRCKREWNAWLAENPIGNDLPGWLEAATKIVTEKRWI